MQTVKDHGVRVFCFLIKRKGFQFIIIFDIFVLIWLIKGLRDLRTTRATFLNGYVTDTSKNIFILKIIIILL